MKRITLSVNNLEFGRKILGRARREPCQVPLMWFRFLGKNTLRKDVVSLIPEWKCI